MMSGPPGKVLLVDDREENLVALQAILGGLGHELLMASSGEQALKHLLVEEVQLILLDVQMPGMDGYDTAAQIKSRPRTHDIPIIFLTAIDREAHQAYRGYAAGAVDFLAKPFDPWVLRAKVEVFVALHQERMRLRERVEVLQREVDWLADQVVLPELGRVERLLAMAGSDPTDGHVIAEAKDVVRDLRARLRPRSD
jgi:CheY-like chemotaxis protein